MINRRILTLDKTVKTVTSMYKGEVLEAIIKIMQRIETFRFIRLKLNTLLQIEVSILSKYFTPPHPPPPKNKTIENIYVKVNA